MIQTNVGKSFVVLYLLFHERDACVSERNTRSIVKFYFLKIELTLAAGASVPLELTQYKHTILEKI